MAKLSKRRPGDAGGTIVKSSSQFYLLMLFLKNQLTNRKSDENLQRSQASTEPDEIVEKESDDPEAAVLTQKYSEVIIIESQSFQQMIEKDASETPISVPPSTERKEPRLSFASRKRTCLNEAYGQALLNIGISTTKIIKENDNSRAK